MNNAKMWLVVKPTVGIPLFLSAVAIGSFSTHVMLLRNTTWIPAFLQGKPKARAAAVDTPAAPVVGSSAVVLFSGSSTTLDVGQEATVVLPDGRTAKVIFTPPSQTTAMIAPETATR
jgi:light-harvesting protein B-800-850 alpha chain